MKEFSAQTGGRYTYADDLENLQDLALAFAAIFDDCDNFVISGCEISGNSVGAGYVYLNGKLRYFSGATNLSGWPQYLIEHNTTESVPYESGSSKVGRNIYGVTIGNRIPATLDPLTGQVPAVLQVNATGMTRMKDAFIGKYALLLNPASGSQRVNAPVNFGQTITADGELITNNSVRIKSGSRVTRMCYQGSTFTVETTGGGSVYQFVVEDGVGFRFYIDGTLIATISKTSINFNKPISSSQGAFGGLALSGNHLYQSTANATATLNINMISYGGNISQFRNLCIGNGKSTPIVSVTGSTGQVDIAGTTTITSGVAEGLVLKGNTAHTNNALVNTIVWKDSSNVVMAKIGYVGTTDQIFNIVSPLYGIQIVGSGYVNIGPAIKENGVLLSEKYAGKSDVTAELGRKANASEVYTKTAANSKFGLLGGGLAQFVSAGTTAAQCRNQIGALGSADLNVCVKLTNLLSDMATSETAKRQIRDNIGAISREDISSITNDSGWCNTSQSTLKIRQIGNIVSIQGSLKTIHSGTVFTIPNNIAPPTYAVEKTICFDGNRAWLCKIDANSRICVVVYCDSNCNKTTNFSLTYMV